MCTSKGFWKILFHTPFQPPTHGKTPTGGMALCQLTFISFQTEMPARGPGQHWGLETSVPRVSETAKGILEPGCMLELSLGWRVRSREH